jgi:cell division protein FtsB
MTETLEMTNTMTLAVQAGSLPMTGTSPVSAGRVRTITRTRSRRASRNMLLTALAVITAVFLLVGLSAYAASIQHANNVLAQENAYLQAEIDSLNSQIVEETKVTKVEEIATEEYGMVYPTSANCIVIDESEKSEGGLAAEIKHEAYN